MKKRTFILKLFAATLMLATSNNAFAGRTAVDILHYTIEEGRPRARTEPIICTADKDAGYVELLFRANLGEVAITLTDSTGNVVDEISIDTATEKFVTLNVLDAQDSYTLIIEGERYAGEGNF